MDDQRAEMHVDDISEVNLPEFLQENNFEEEIALPESVNVTGEGMCLLQ